MKKILFAAVAAMSSMMLYSCDIYHVEERCPHAEEESSNPEYNGGAQSHSIKAVSSAAVQDVEIQLYFAGQGEVLNLIEINEASPVSYDVKVSGAAKWLFSYTLPVEDVTSQSWIVYYTDCSHDSRKLRIDFNGYEPGEDTIRVLVDLSTALVEYNF